MLQSAVAPSPPAPTRAALPECPVCGACRWREPAPGTALRGCPGCGTVFHDRSTSRIEEEALYQTYTEAETGWKDPVALSQWGWVRQQFPAVDSVLDVGCGYGAFLDAARGAGTRVGGIDLAPAAVAACRRRGLDVREGSVFDGGVPSGPWGLITLWDVLEHLEHPQLALERLVPELAPGGVLVIRGRNAAMHAPLKALYARFRPAFRRMGVPDVTTVHRWGLRVEGYRRLLKAAGLTEIQSHPGIPTPGDRFGTLGPTRLLKGAVRGGGTSLFRLSGGRLYPFPTILVSATRPR